MVGPVNDTLTEISILEDALPDPGVTQNVANSQGYVIVLAGGIVLFVTTVLLLYLKRRVGSSHDDEEDDLDVYLISKDANQLQQQQQQQSQPQQTQEDEPAYDKDCVEKSAEEAKEACLPSHGPGQQV